MVGLAIGLVAATLGGAAWFRVGRAVEVPIREAAPGRVAERVVGPGTLQARVPVTLGSRITATVRELSVDVGDTVRPGQVLALLDDRDLAARRGVVEGQQRALVRSLEAARAGTARAEAEFELARSRQRRDAELLRTGFMSPSALEASDAALRGAQANLDAARATQAAREADAHTLAEERRFAEAQLSFARIVAPAGGVVIARQAEVGSTVVPGSVLFKLADPAALWVAVRVDEAVVGRVREGQPASIRLRSGERLPGRVARITRQSDAATRELEVDVAFDQPPARFAIDQEAEVAIGVGETAGIAVPLSALVRDRDGHAGVLVVEAADGGRTAFRPVRTGASDGLHVLLAEGLAAGERFVAEADGVKAGARVRPRGETAR
ncbi:MAG: efflux RND transporter periplasmic adaptor subunit [Pseudomonadota bacterium]